MRRADQSAPIVGIETVIDLEVDTAGFVGRQIRVESAEHPEIWVIRVTTRWRTAGDGVSSTPGNAGPTISAHKGSAESGAGITGRRSPRRSVRYRPRLGSQCRSNPLSHGQVFKKTWRAGRRQKSERLRKSPVQDLGLPPCNVVAWKVARLKSGANPSAWQFATVLASVPDVP